MLLQHPGERGGREKNKRETGRERESKTAEEVGKGK